MALNLLIQEIDIKRGEERRKSLLNRHTFWPLQHVVAVCPKLYVRHKRHGSPVELDGLVQASTLLKLDCFVEQFCSLFGGEKVEECMLTVRSVIFFTYI